MLVHFCFYIEYDVGAVHFYGGQCLSSRKVSQKSDDFSTTQNYMSFSFPQNLDLYFFLCVYFPDVMSSAFGLAILTKKETAERSIIISPLKINTGIKVLTCLSKINQVHFFN